MDLSSITTALSMVKSASEIVQVLKEAGSSLERAEFKLKLAELMEHLADVKLSLADVRSTLEEKDREIAALIAKFETKEAVFYQAPYYFKRLPDDSSDGPFCQKCHDTQNQLVRLQQHDRGSWHCYACQSHVVDSSYIPPPPITREAIFGIY